ncbi:Disease resistance protein (TIR-NBS-LRR class) family [Raphanus sativus]|nr:Disease resistance protein (TIR-NBS-LRR class) family [Raphanus sativus]
MALSSSSSSSSRTWLYDVFPSFSGEDVRVTFLSHFLKELDRKLIIAFKDSEIQRSQSLDPKLKQAIRDSRIAVVIISKNYASSRWCLNELLEIVKCREECGQMVIPVFYGLGASHVRKQTGEFGQIFEETCQDETEEGIIQWRRALTDVANTLGYHSVNWDNEAKMIEEIVSDVLDKLLLTSSKDSEDFVGIEYHIAKLSVLLQLEDEQVRMVGLWGSSGVGKTTIARVLFQRFSRHFQSSIFIDRAFLSKSMEIYSKANPDDYNMKLHLQGHFLSKILGKGDIKINHLSAIWERLKHHKVLIFIDDLDDQVVLDALVGQPQWFGSGSRIILVTNDKHFLRGHGVDHIYEVCLPSEDLAREMLCRSAFKKTTAPEDFKELVFKVAQLAGRLPLGLSVLGSSLRGRDKEYWMDLLSRLQNGIDEKIEQTLRVSYDELRSEEDKKIFRYIACFFNGAQVTNMKLLLGESDMSVNLGLKNLADRSLIHVREGHVEMHCLLQEMGKKVVRLEKPEKREFLVDSQDTCDVLSEGIGTQNVIGILLDLDEIDELHIHENAFTGMRNLRFLKIYSKLGLYREVKCQLPENFDYFPPKLKLLRWDNYRMRCMPSKFRPENLVKFEMRYSKLEKLWEGVVSLPCLKEMDLRYSYHLIEMPDLSKATNLETLTLKNCYSLVKLPSSIPHPNKLKKLDMICCQNLETIPIGISLKSVEQLFLGGCSRLRTFPQISTNILHLTIDKTSIEELPSNLNLENIYCLSMTKLKSKKLWERVQMDGCNNLGYVYLNFCKHEHGLYVNFSHCKALTGVGWSDSPRRDNIYLDFTNCSNLDQEALFQQKTYFQSQLRLSGEEVPSYFTHRTTGTFSLSIPLLPTSLSQPFLRFRVCIVFNDNMSEIDAECRFTGSFWNSSDSYDQAQYFCADTEDYTIFLYKKDSCLFILDCQMSHIPLEMNFDHVDLEIHFNGSSDMEIDIKDSFGSLIDIKEWGIRIIEEDFSAADNRLGNPDILPHVFEANESNMINEVGEGEECAGEDEVTEARSKRMRVVMDLDLSKSELTESQTYHDFLGFSSLCGDCSQSFDKEEENERASRLDIVVTNRLARLRSQKDE